MLYKPRKIRFCVFYISQNIDGLERMAGIPKEKVLEVHGTMEEGFCQKCFHIYTKEDMSSKSRNTRKVIKAT